VWAAVAQKGLGEPRSPPQEAPTGGIRRHDLLERAHPRGAQDTTATIATKRLG